MNFLTLGIHYPKPEDLEKFIGATQDIADKARTLDGLIDTGAWLDGETGGVVLLSLWASKEQAEAARPILGPLVKATPFGEWESRPATQFVRLDRLV